MKRRLPWRKILVAAGQVVVILVAHAVLVHSLAETDVVATILSAGPHAPAGHLVIAGGFAMVRILAVLLLPGIILNHLVQIALDKWIRGGADTSAQEGEARDRTGQDENGIASQENP